MDLWGGIAELTPATFFADGIAIPPHRPKDPQVHAAEIPSSNGITTARALARFYNLTTAITKSVT